MAGAGNRIASIQVLRAFAALAVAYGHAGADAGALAARQGSSFSAPLMAISPAGVDLFFLISGFVMVHASQGLFAAPSAPRRFFERRLIRILPLYWLVTAAYLLLVLALPGVMNAPPPDLAGIVRSFLFIPYERADGLAQPVYGLGWTLNYEMMFYALFALCILLPMQRAVLAVAAVLAAGVIAGASFAPLPQPLRFWSDPIVLEFALGMGLGVLAVRGNRLSRASGLALAAIGFAAFVLANPSGMPENGFLRLVTIGLPMALVLAGLALSDWPELGGGLLERIGDASYALYLIHPFALRGTRLIWGALPEAFGGWIYMVAALATAIAAALALHVLFEKPVMNRLMTAVRAGRPR